MNITEAREKLGAVLAPIEDSDPDVLTNLVDAIEPPALMIGWGEPWLDPEGRTACLVTGRLVVVCVAARLVPGEGIAQLEQLVGYVLDRLRADSGSWPLDTVDGPRVFTIAKTNYLAARVPVRVQINTSESVMPDLQPLILIDPILTIDGVPLECLMSHVELTPDVSVIEITTSCGVKEYPGAVKWTLKASLYHSHDPAGTNETLTAAVEGGVPVPFTVIPSSDPISATNPEYTGEVIPQPFTPIAGDVGDASSFDLEWSIQGWGNVPTTNITPALARSAKKAAAANA